MAKKKTSPRKFCFVLMPFDDEFNDIYELGIKESCAKAGAYCERVDEQIYQESILDRIFNQIAKADFIIADMTGRNPNVFYEVGYAHALGKPTILLTQKVDDIPFDLKHFPHIVYDNKIVELRDELKRRVKWFINNSSEDEVSSTIDIDLYIEGQNIDETSVMEMKAGYPFHGKISVHNRSTITLQPDSFQIGIETPSFFYTSDPGAPYETLLPNGRTLHYLPNPKTLFPNGYGTYNFSLPFTGKSPELYQEHEMVFRIFTPAGTRDFPTTCIWLPKSDN